MNTEYTTDRSTQIVLSALKAHGIRKVIVSPGTTNIGLVASMQYDSFFEMFSSVDERSAAYIACGMAEESGEPVVITCTEATASRNYMSGLTEAYYRKLPVLAITGCHHEARIGHLNAQVIDRRNVPNDVVRHSVSIPAIHTQEEEWSVVVKVNQAILELFRHGGGPVHINLEGVSKYDFSSKDLPPCRIIQRIMPLSKFPQLPNGRIAIFIGAHYCFSAQESESIDAFCKSVGAVVFCDHTSGYYGGYACHFAHVCCQEKYYSPACNVDLLIHIGEVSGDVYSQFKIFAKEVWRVSRDGEVRDTFQRLSYVFEMSEEYFFSQYTINNIASEDYLHLCHSEYNKVFEKLPTLKFSNIWIAHYLHDKLPSNSVIHFGIFNSLRSWNFFQLPSGVRSNCNVGGFGIDGAISTVIGAALVNPTKLYFCIVGDLAFFYDMNALGNRHLPSNIRILLVNNGRGTEFCNYDHPASVFGEDANAYIAAAGHFGAQSSSLVKYYAECLGFSYISASNKDDFTSASVRFLSSAPFKPILFESFIDSIDDSSAIHAVRNILSNTSGMGLKKWTKRIWH